MKLKSIFTLICFSCVICFFLENSIGKEKNPANFSLDYELEKFIDNDSLKTTEKSIKNKIQKCSKLIKNDPVYPRYSYCAALSTADPSICVSESEFPDFCKAGSILMLAIKEKDYNLCHKIKFPKNRSLCIFLTFLKSGHELLCDKIEDEDVKNICEENKINRTNNSKEIDKNLKKIITLWNKKYFCTCETKKCKKKRECSEIPIVYNAISSSLKGKISDRCRVYLGSTRFKDCPVQIYHDNKIIINPIDTDLICTAFVKTNHNHSSIIDNIRVPPGNFKILFKNNENIKLINLYCLEPLKDFDFLWFYERY